MGKFAQVRKAHDVARIGGSTRFVGNPNLYTVHGDTRSNGRQLLHVVIVTVAEEMSQEEMAVLIVSICRELVTGQLCSPFTAYAGRGRLLLGKHGRQL